MRKLALLACAVLAACGGDDDGGGGGQTQANNTPAGNANATRMSANALITLAAAATLTPNWRAKAGMPGATIP